MSVLLSTTGTLNPVTIGDFGGREFLHPDTNDYILSDEYSYAEIRDSSDLGVALNAGYITLVNNGDVIINSNDLKELQPEPNTVPVIETEGVVLLDRVYSLTLTGNVSVITIPDLKDYNKIEINSSKNCDIKSITATGLPKGFTIVIHNISDYELKFKKNQGGGGILPADRFDFEPELKLKKKSFTLITREDSDNIVDNHRWNRQNEK